VATLLVIVSRTRPAQYPYLKRTFGNEVVDVVLDRRLEERRQRQAQVGAERRRGSRRQRDLTKQLQEFGWAVARRQTSAPSDEGQAQHTLLSPR